MEIDTPSNHQRCSRNRRVPQCKTSVGDLRRTQRKTSEAIFEISIRSITGNALREGKRRDELALQRIFEALRKTALYFRLIS